MSSHVSIRCILSCLCFLSLCAVGCAPSGQDGFYCKRTRAQLQALGLLIQELIEAGVDEAELDTLEKALSAARKRNLLGPTEYPDENYRIDSWGRPFHWELQKGPNMMRIRMTSYGKRGLPDDNCGEHIRMVVTLAHTRSVTLTLEPPAVPANPEGPRFD